MSLSQQDYRSLAEFRYQIRRFLHFSELAASAEGLEGQQHQMMLAIQALHDDEGPTIGQLAEYLFIRHHSAVGLLDRLESHQLAERTRGVTDRRQVRVRLTPHGKEKLKRLSNAHRTELKNSGPVLVHALTAVLKSE